MKTSAADREQPCFSALVIDDDQSMRDSLAQLLRQMDWTVRIEPSAEQGLARLASEAPDVILCDIRMPGMSGLELLHAATGPHAPPVVLISAHGDIPMAVEAMREGAYSFIEKPFDPSRLLAAMRNAAMRHRLNKDAARLKDRLARLSGLDRILLGETEAIGALREEVIDLASIDATVLIQGDTGTGKELVARALHDLGARAAGPFIPLSCASVPVSAFEEALFGVEESAPGAMIQADGGTLFLDEVAGLAPEAQAKLSRAIETKEATPLGAGAPIRVDIRIVSASNEPLAAAVAENRFRSDLYYRLGAVILALPALRERRSDIPLLFQRFSTDFARLYEIDAPALDAEDLAALMSHDWPGNVRELRNVAERRVLAARRGRGSVPEAIGDAGEIGDVPETLREAVAAFERQLIGRALRAHGGRMEAVAEALGIGRRTLNEKIVKLGLDKSEYL